MDTATVLIALLVIALIGGVIVWAMMGSNGGDRRDTTYVVDRPVWGGWGGWGNGGWGGWGGWGRGRGRHGWYHQDNLSENPQDQQPVAAADQENSSSCQSSMHE